jgi:apolipoprotein N-acyltransferase
MLSQGLRMYDPQLPRSRVYLPAILSGLLLYASFFPLNLGFLGWIALVPFLSLVRANARSRRIYMAAFVGGLFCYVPAIQWIRVAHPAMYGAWIFLGIVCSLFLVMTLALIRKLDRVGVPLWLSAPIGFIAVEYFRSHFPTGYTWMEMFDARHPIGFGWYMVGHTQHDYLQLVQIADITGVYGVTFLVVMLNAVIWSLAERRPEVRWWLRVPGDVPPASRRPSAIAITLLLATFAYGVLQTNGNGFPDGPRVALIQGNLEQDIKNLKGDKMREHFDKLATQAAHPAPNQQKPDLIVWPETSYVTTPRGSFTLPWTDVKPGTLLDIIEERKRREGFLLMYNNARLDIEEDAREWQIPTLLGWNTVQLESDGKFWTYNSALLIDAKGKPVARYDKIHLVPLGEYIPFPETFPFLKHFTPNDAEYSCRPGESYTRFPLQVGDKTYHFGCLICYEDTDASLARQYVRPGEQNIDFLVNISNDGWFKGTEEHEQHLAICQLRAIETRRSVVRAVNMGISAIIDPNGKVIAMPGDTWASSKKVEGIVRGSVPIDTRTTLYSRLGDWLPLIGWAVIGGGFILGFVRRRKAA